MYFDCDEEQVVKYGTFFVQASPPLRVERTRRVPAHRLVIEPIVKKATEVRIYASPKTAEFAAHIWGIGMEGRDHVDIDLSLEVVRAHEWLWNADGWSRGAIVVAARLTDEDFAEIFHWCDGPGTWSSMAEVKKGTPAAATKYARATALNGLTALSFSASNGLQLMDVFPVPEDAIRTFRLAQRTCRRFKRFVEHNPGADEIVVDREPYIGFI